MLSHLVQSLLRIRTLLWRINKQNVLVSLLAIFFLTTGTTSALGDTIIEDFESGSKTVYGLGEVTLKTGVWTLEDALIGTRNNDVKDGEKAVRIQNSGKLTTFEYPKTITSISISHAKYGADEDSTWQLLCSPTGATAWQQIGATVTTNSTKFKTAIFTPNIQGKVRCQIYKNDGSANRINIDNVTITDSISSGSISANSQTNDTVKDSKIVSNNSVHLTLGNPSNAVTSTSSADNYLLIKPQYALSYNNTTRTPNWVSWQLNSSWIGSAPRRDAFRADTSLPPEFYQVTPNDYKGSGFDKGHMCPSADRNNTPEDNFATFFMTNMIPQAPDNNRGIWADLEEYTRILMEDGKELYIISVTYGIGGTGEHGTYKTIADGKIQVPHRTWKVIVVSTPGAGVAGITEKTRVIAVDIPNEQGIYSDDWRKYRVSVDALESKTGFDFLSNVPTSIQTVIEAQVDNL